MAIVKGPIQLSGSLSNISFYTRRGSNQVIARTKGGVSGDKIKRLPQYEGMRLQQKEWSGVTKMASAIRYTFGGLHRLADYNLTSVLNGLVNKMQKADDSGEKGKRPLRLSLFRQALAGFNFNRNYPFNSVLAVSINYELNRHKLSATVNFPRINTEIDLKNIQRLPFFRVIVALGAVSDMIFDENLKDYVPTVPGLQAVAATTNSIWFSANSIVDSQVLEVHLSEQQVAMLSDEVSVVLSIAVEFGTVGLKLEPVEVKYAGSGKVLAIS